MRISQTDSKEVTLTLSQYEGAVLNAAMVQDIEALGMAAVLGISGPHDAFIGSVCLSLKQALESVELLGSEDEFLAQFEEFRVQWLADNRERYGNIHKER